MTASKQESKNLFKPIKVGDVELSNRIVVPPLTRNRASKDSMPTDIMEKYYDERTTFPGYLVITEAAFVSPDGYPNVPGIYTNQQALAWKKIVDKVHANKSFLSIQLGSLGRAAVVNILNEKKLKYVAPSAIYESEDTKEVAEKLNNRLTALTTSETKEHVQHFVNAAVNAVDIAGFDFVEIHAAHGYLIDQFTQSISNQRTDEYGGSIENRARFLFEIVDGIIEKIGVSKLALRLSPWATFGGMTGANGDPHPYATWGYIFSELEKRRKNHGKDFGYISIVEPRVNGTEIVEKPVGSNEWIFDIYKGVILRTGNYCDMHEPVLNLHQLARDVDSNDRTLIGIGRPITSNPDLISRLKNGQKLANYEREYFYTHTSKGYIGYPSFGNQKIEIQDVLGKPLC